MAKTQKELAFLREICLAEDWTKRFTDLIDKHFEFSDDENLLYINAGTGNHVFALREKIKQQLDQQIKTLKSPAAGTLRNTTGTLEPA